MGIYMLVDGGGPKPESLTLSYQNLELFYASSQVALLKLTP